MGCPMEGRFVDAGSSDGIVIDNCTGLMWQRGPANVNGDDHIGYEDQVTWREALQYRENLSFGGYDDWRLPKQVISLLCSSPRPPRSP